MARSRFDYGGDLVPTTVRFTSAGMDAVNQLAKLNGISTAEMIRYIVDENLEKYLSKVVFVEHSDAVEFRKILHEVLTEMSFIKTELKRIGINYNQEMKLKQIENKYSDIFISYEDMMLKDAEIKEVKNSESLSIEKLNSLMSRFEEASKKVGELVCLIRE